MNSRTQVTVAGATQRARSAGNESDRSRSAWSLEDNHLHSCDAAQQNDCADGLCHRDTV
jgi:hypothetical protein